MTKKRNVKTTADEETDRSCRESSSDGSVLENPIKGGNKSNKSRKCKVQGSNKTASILKNKKNPKSKSHSDSSGDFVAKEECNLSKEVEDIPPDDKNVTMPVDFSDDSTGNNSQEPISDNKAVQPKINSDKYSELLSILSRKEGDIDTFIKQYTIWQQSQLNTGKHLKAKKNVNIKSQKLPKPMKSKAMSATPLIKLTNKAKKINRSSVPDKDYLKEPDSSVSEIKINNTERSRSMCMEDTNTEINKGNSDEDTRHLNDIKTENEHSKEMAKEIAIICEDVNRDIEHASANSTEKSKNLNDNSNAIRHGNRKFEEQSKKEIDKCLDAVNTPIKDDTNFKDSSKYTIDNKSENSASKEIEASDLGNPYVATEIMSNIVNNVEKPVSEGEDNLKNKEIIVDLEKKDLVHGDGDKKAEISEINFLDFHHPNNLITEKNQENNCKNNICSSEGKADSKNNDEVINSNELLSHNFYTKDSFSEIGVHDCKTNQPINDKCLDSTFVGILPHLKPKSQPCSSLSNNENNCDEFLASESKQKVESKGEKPVILNVNNSILIEGDSESDIVWKRKRRMSDETNECSKRVKPITRLNETKSDELQHDLTSSDTYFNKWNTEESNSFFEELIYSDEEKINNLIDAGMSYNVSKSADDHTKCKDTLSHTIKKQILKSDLDKKKIEKLNTKSYQNEDNDESPKNSKRSNKTENVIIPHKKDYKEWKEKKRTNDSSQRTKHHMKDKDKITNIGSKSKKQMKIKLKPKLKKSSSHCMDDLDNLQIRDEFDNSYESMLKKVKKQLKNGHKSILETDLPVVEVSYKGESLHGILGSVYSVDFLTMYKLNDKKQSNENILSSNHAQDILVKSLHPLCLEMLRESTCKDLKTCRKEHMVPNDFFSIMDKHDAWLIIAFILRISECLSENMLTAILEFLAKYKARKKILLVSRHVFQSEENHFPVLKSCWEDIFTALEFCGLQRWEGIRSVIQFIVDNHSSVNAVIFHQLLNIWNVHGSSFSNTWQIVEPLVTRKIIVLHPLILSKLMGEIMVVESKDKVTVYQVLVQQLTSLSKDNFNQISYRLLNDFLRKVSQEGLHSEEKLLREMMNTSCYIPFFPQQPSAHSNSSLRRCRSLTNLTSISTDSKFHINTTVHEEEKMDAAMQRALQCSNYDSMIKVIISSSKKVFINKVLLVVFKYVLDKNSYIILKNIFSKLKTSFAQYIDEVKDLIGNIVVTVMLNYVKQYNWMEANNYFNLLEENHVNKYKLKSLNDGTLRPVRLAVVYSEIHYYNGRYKESIGVFINTRLMDPDSAQWAIPGGSKEDFHIIGVMIAFLLNELINKKIINIATMLFKAVLEAQSSLTEPLDISPFFEALLYKLFELTEEYPETAVKLYLRVIGKDSTVNLYGLTYRALIILAYRTHKRAIIKDIFYKAINEYVYPNIEENENVIMLLRSHTEEEIIVYILEWVARFKEKQSDYCDHQIQIRFKDAALEDYLDNKALGIPALLKEVDQSLPGVFKRLESVLKRLHIKFKQIKKDAFSIEPLSFQNFLNKIKVC